MKLTEEKIQIIEKQFRSLRSKEDLVILINKVNKFLYGNDYRRLTIKGLNYYTNPHNTEKRYQTFSVKKKSGNNRTIHAPVNSLKHILKPLNLIFNIIATPHEKAMGFVPKKSIIDNAKQHVGYNYVYNIDLKDFFYSFDLNRVKLGLMYHPFNLNNDLEPLAYLLASLCTHPFKIDEEIKTVLPQGAPTSPTLSNILCIKLDRRLNGLSKRFNINYSRYADDITFSSHRNIFRDKEFTNELKRIIEDQKFTINEQKTRLQQKEYRQEVTGIIVNEKVNVNSKYIKQLRMWIYYWEKYGYDTAKQLFYKDYSKDDQGIKKSKPNFKNVLFGKLEFLKMIKGAENPTYKKLYARYKKLYQKSFVEKIEEIKSETVKESNYIDDRTELEYIDPSNLSKFLKEYNENPVLKYTCHTIDDQSIIDNIIQRCGTEIYIFEKHLELILSEHSKLNNKFFNKIGKIYAHIYTYLTGHNTTGWTDDGIKMNWSSDELLSWANSNPGRVPNPGGNLSYTGFEFYPIEIKSTGGHEIFNFNDLVIHFKHLTHIRADNSLKSILSKQNSLNNFDKLCDVSFPDFKENIEFFTDVNKLIQAYKAIIKMIFTIVREHSMDKPRIELTLEDDSKFIYFKIHHKNSVYKKSLHSALQKRKSEKLSSIIENQINGLCDFYLKADFDKEYAQISLWSSNNETCEKLDFFEGVQFILKIHR